MKQKKITFQITEEEMDIIESVAFLEPFLQDNIKGAVEENGMLKIEFEPGDLDDTIGAIEYALESAIVSKEPRQYALLVEKLKRYLRLLEN